MENENKTCVCCGCTDEELTEVAGGDLVCQDCLSSEYSYCEECGEWHPVECVHLVRVSWRSEKFVCESCLENVAGYFQCDDCGEWHYDGYRGQIETDDGSRICSYCYEDHYFTCYGCGNVFHNDNANWDEASEEYYCEECAKKRSVIRGYGYKPRPVFKTKHDSFHTDSSIKDLLFGVENEIDDGCDPLDTAADICKASADVYVKHDGSLGEEGMEIVTHPCTLEYHTEQLGWEQICNVALSSDYRSHDARTCGLHVHVGRKQLGETNEERKETVARIIVLVDRHWDAMVRFSRRRERQLMDWAKRPDLGLDVINYSEERLIEAALDTKRRGRYMAVNLQNYDTIEFRIFNGTLKYETIHATLQLVSNICLYAKTHSMAEVLKSNWNEITEYQLYGELQKYLKMKGLDYVDNPHPVYLVKEEPKKDKTKFKVGDIVRIENARGFGVDALNFAIGLNAVIIEEFNPELSSFDYGVQFEDALDETYSRTVNGIYYQHTYNVHAANIRLITDDEPTLDF